MQENTYGAYGEQTAPMVNYALLLGGLVGGLLIGAAVMMFIAPHSGRYTRKLIRDRADKMQQDTGKRLHQLNKRGRKNAQEMLDRARDELSQLEDDGRKRLGDLKHQAKVLRKKADVRQLEKQLLAR